ncbi:hypothetical protein [Arthrobacter sp. efr-133-TYG-118]|uniref:hypothetical protein n=1 Tax=Arthrobacter sp. efr-133-TYG-118 TaxID=3040279 RepID=UPI00254B747C|nr:hypothetical protein [Arthrobacter sp. efr-133-TYG-118]
MNSNELAPESNEEFVRLWKRDAERVAKTWLADIQRNRVQRGGSPLLEDRELEFLRSIVRIFGQLSPASQELWKATAAMASIVQGQLPEIDEAETTVAHRSIEIGGHVYLDEDVCDGTQVPPRAYIFEAYDSDAPADANCTIVDVLTGDWTLRGFGELVSVNLSVEAR